MNEFTELQKYSVEAVLHARRRPVDEVELTRLFPGAPIPRILASLDDDYKGRGMMVVKAAGGWCLRTRPEASDLASHFATPPPRLTRAALEVLAAIAAFQTTDPVTRSDIERIRNVSLSPTIFDALFEAGYIKPGRRRETPGRPLTWVTTDRFLEAFDIGEIANLPPVQKMQLDGLLKLPRASVTKPEGAEEELSV